MKPTRFTKIAAWVLTLILALSIASIGVQALETSSGAQSPSGEAPGAPPDGGSGSAPSGQAPGAPPDGTGGGGSGANTMTYDYTGALTGALTANGTQKSSDGESISASDADENAALAENCGSLTITNGTLSKSGDDTNGDNCNFYGLNSILLAVGDGSSACLSDSSLTAESEGSNGIFATDGAEVYANNDTIVTSAGNSRGLDATYGGTILANRMDISTAGDHCAALATDRGGGSISVANSTLATAGSGSPLLYSTGDIEVDGVTGTAAGSQIAGMEGLNTIRIYNSQLTSTHTSATGSDPIADGIILYQSTSGDAESATGEAASFEVSNSTLSSAITSGAMFYVTNTSANVVLSGTTLDFDSEHVKLLVVQGNDANNWGTPGSNGGTVRFTALGETLRGDIDVDSISSVNLWLLEGTTYTGAMNISANAVNTAAAEAPITVNLDGSSVWVVTADSTVTNLNAAAGSSIVDENGKTVTIVVNGVTEVQGESDRTVTVTGSRSAAVSADSTNALSTDYIDRSAFDSYYGTSTLFASAETVSAETANSDAETETTGSRLLPCLLGIGAAGVLAGVVIGTRKKRGHSR